MRYCYCLNPDCSRPKNPVKNTYCHGCKEALVTSTQSYLFRLHYRITKFLGEGAFGRTYLAEDTDLMGEPRVIKKLIANASGLHQNKIRELFLREAKQLYHIHHPQIPKLYAYFEQNNALYLVQEFIEGDNLFQEFSKTGAFSEEKIKFLLQDLLPVLDYLHSNKILHRDIKPQNIMRCQKTGHLILIDFGGVKQVSDTFLETEPVTMIYTPGYAAIEQIMGRPSSASDIYSLGATCVRLLTGCFATKDKFGNLRDELYDINTLKWRWQEYLQKQGRKINEELRNILDKMLAEMVDNRYQSVREILAILNPTISVEPQQPIESIQQLHQQPKALSNNIKIATETWVEISTTLTPLFLKRCEQELTRCIGPIAHFLLEDTLAQHPRIAPQKLVEILATEIPDPQNAKQFKEHLL